MLLVVLISSGGFRNKGNVLMGTQRWRNRIYPSLSLPILEIFAGRGSIFALTVVNRRYAVARLLRVASRKCRLNRWMQRLVSSAPVSQAAEIKVDALPGEILQGKVESLSPASGVSYSPIALHNATGNFTKMVRRLPVRINKNKFVMGFVDDQLQSVSARSN